MSDKVFDLFVIGGGINGSGIARDAAGRGYSVVLAEMGDLASGTSSAATKLIHGGLRYLEYYEFGLVRKALGEREVLWALAPHIIKPIRFILPHHRGLRPALVLRAGLAMYDHMGGRKRLPPTRTLDLRHDPAGVPLKPGFALAFEFSDCWVDDARLVVLNARDAADRGADIRTRTRVTGARRDGAIWRVAVENQRDGETSEVAARMLVNAAGPWVDAVTASVKGPEAPPRVRLVKGSHIVVRKLFDHDKSYFFQNADGRILFALPYETDFTLIGTTDLDYEGDPSEVAITADEISYLIEAANAYFAEQVTRDRVVWAFSGVRPLFDDGASTAQEATRDYVLKLENTESEAPCLVVYGGKLTTYRRLAEEVLSRIDSALGRATTPWTARTPLPGGDFDVDGVEREVLKLMSAHTYLPPETANRLIGLYGTRAMRVLDGATSRADLGEDFGAGLTEKEVAYLIENEWAETVEDIIWRRTKLGLRLEGRDIRALERYLATWNDVASGEGK
ncbi:MAG: glycerol-3-phosphate dehydrogenase [Alphaproteobacteria bacterium]|nr:glycerol-3-phosphate dehydrogenase [Alphaproteobacteria bacterium]